MSKLNIDQKTVHDLFRDKRSDFLIPDYQRPYAWSEDQCQTLWEDILAFAIPDNDESKFNDSEEYFLGPIVTFRNENGLLEVIDGQQRLTTLMLLLRAFYARFENMQDDKSVKTRDSIAECVWKTDEFGDPAKDQLKINSEVASDDDKNEFLEILRTGKVEKDQKSRYAQTFIFYRDKIDDFIDRLPTYTPYLANRILRNVILLPIEAESQNTALRIFSTLNDRGLPLSDADIFKSQFYKYFTDKGAKEDFVERWKQLESVSEQVFARSRSNPMDELFTRYMYYVRATRGIRDTTTGSLRDFYEKNSYELLKSEQTLIDLESLLSFWEAVINQDDEFFSEQVLKQLYVLENAPNRLWTYLVSVYFMHNKDAENGLEQQAFTEFLEKIIGFIWAYAILRPGVSNLRTPIYPEMVNLVKGNPVTFENYKFDADQLAQVITGYVFTNTRQITKSMLVWWAYQNENQELFNLDTKLEVEHIFAKRRANAEGSLKDKNSLESLGNKAILEKNINIRASDYRFEDKKKYYSGYDLANGKHRDGTKSLELVALAEKQNDFTEQDITSRKAHIIDEFIKYLAQQNLIED